MRTRSFWRNRLSCLGVLVGVLVCRELSVDIEPAIDPTAWIMVALFLLLPVSCAAHGWLGWFLGSEVDRVTGTNSASPIFSRVGGWASSLALLGLVAGLSFHVAFETALKYVLPITASSSVDSLLLFFCLAHAVLGWRLGTRLDRIANPVGEG